MVDVFISYPRSERARVEPIREKLEALELDVFFDLDGIDGGANFPDVIDRALRASKSVLCCWSPVYFTRPWCMIECRDALARGLLTPAVIDRFDAMTPPADLRQISYYDLTDWEGEDWHEDWRRLLRSLGNRIGRALPGADATELDAILDQSEQKRLIRDLRKTREAELAASPAGTVFRDALKGGGNGPEMCIIPAGSFLMGSPEDEPERDDNEGPQHGVRIARPFALGRFALTFDEYDAFCDANGVAKPSDGGWGRKRRPAINLSWEDANFYCRWLSEQAGADYRLPTEAEWEYACRAGTTTPFWWGEEITPDKANYNGEHLYSGGGAKGGNRRQTETVDALAPNLWGLHKTHGNVLEWCQDCWNDAYHGAPTDGSAWMFGDCYFAPLRGGCWCDMPGQLRSAQRESFARDYRASHTGFRIARTFH